MIRSRLFLLALLTTPLLALGCGDDSAQGNSPPTNDGLDAGQSDTDVPDSDAGSPDADNADAPEDDGSVDSGQPVDTTCSEPARTFWVYNLSVMPPKYEERSFSCRAATDHVRIWVSDTIWDDSVTEQDVQDVAMAMDFATPADPASGIYDIATSVFGEPTDVDLDGTIHVLYDDLGQFQGTGFDGYIRPEDMLGGPNSNDAEVLYLDGVRNDITGEYMLGVIAHEFQHMIHLNHDLDEDGWMDETLSEASMVATGYYGDLDTWVANDFAKQPNQSLTVSPPTFNYGAGFLFGAYLFQRFEPSFLAALVSEQKNGMAGLDAVLSTEGVSRSSLFADWALANFLDAPDLDDGAYGYEAFEVPALSVLVRTLPVADTPLKVNAAAARYVLLDTGSASDGTVQITLATTGFADLEVRTVAYTDGDPSSAVVGSVALTSSSDVVTISGVGGSVDRALLVMVNPSESAIDATVSATLQ